MNHKCLASCLSLLSAFVEDWGVLQPVKVELRSILYLCTFGLLLEVPYPQLTRTRTTWNHPNSRSCGRDRRGSRETTPPETGKILAVGTYCLAASIPCTGRRPSASPEEGSRPIRLPRKARRARNTIGRETAAVRMWPAPKLEL